MTAAKATSEEAVAKTLASHGELTGAEIAAATGLGRSTVSKTLAALRPLPAVGAVRARLTRDAARFLHHGSPGRRPSK